MVRLKEKIKKHYELSKRLSKEYDDVYGEMVLYLRNSKLSDIDAEDAIGDILAMLLEGQERGAEVEDILGSDLKEFCDNIISSYGNGTRRIKAREFVQLSLLLVVISTFWGYVNIELPKVTKGFQSWVTFNFSLAMLLNIVIMSASACFIVKYVLKSNFEKDQNARKKKSRIESFIIVVNFLSVVAALVAVGIFFKDIILFTTKIYWVVLVLALMFFMQKFMEPKVE